MAASAVTTTGLDELQRAADAFPAELTRALQAVAETHGRRIQVKAQQALDADLRKAIHITLTSDPAKHEVRIEASNTQAYPTSVALWFELGTAQRRQKRGRYTGQIEAKHYMLNASQSQDASYKQALAAAAEQTARLVFAD